MTHPENPTHLQMNMLAYSVNWLLFIHTTLISLVYMYVYVCCVHVHFFLYNRRQVGIIFKPLGQPGKDCLH